MQVGILSDIHDNIAALRQALEKLRHTDVLLCCGDLCSPFIITELVQNYARDIHIVFGNNDGDLFRITNNSKAFPHLHLHGEMAELTFDDCRFGINHYDTIGRIFADSGRYDVVCFGHNHQFEISQTANTLVINPGEILGGLTGNSTYVTLDTIDRTPERHDLT
ncbi:MAG: hypothetical protein M2R45_03802 [Verrucomicrobia subdivision 3 bacterium]|nr:hypothetical protein [Limisphaerales bacterium]MCS1416757.1 hypothetical protein [Limisphaerales bacterium]